jgi:hypothetical protein
MLLKDPHNIILTSGTLYPFETWEFELGMSFKTTLNNSHVIDTKNSILSGVL